MMTHKEMVDTVEGGETVIHNGHAIIRKADVPTEAQLASTPEQKMDHASRLRQTAQQMLSEADALASAGVEQAGHRGAVAGATSVTTRAAPPAGRPPQGASGTGAAARAPGAAAGNKPADQQGTGATGVGAPASSQTQDEQIFAGHKLSFYARITEGKTGDDRTKALLDVEGVGVPTAAKIEAALDAMAKDSE